MTIDKWVNPLKFDMDKYNPKMVCHSMRHNPPSHLYVPPGQTYTYVCPSCGQVSTMFGSDATW